MRCRRWARILLACSELEEQTGRPSKPAGEWDTGRASMTATGTPRHRSRRKLHRSLLRLVLGLVLCLPHGLTAVPWQSADAAGGATRCCCVGECRCTGSCCNHGPSSRTTPKGPVMTTGAEGLSDGNTCRQSPAAPARPRPDDLSHGDVARRVARLPSPLPAAWFRTDFGRLASTSGLLIATPPRGPPVTQSCTAS
jgi:hypothetical protein